MLNKKERITVQGKICELKDIEINNLAYTLATIKIKNLLPVGFVFLNKQKEANPIRLTIGQELEISYQPDEKFCLCSNTRQKVIQMARLNKDGYEKIREFDYEFVFYYFPRSVKIC